MSHKRFVNYLKANQNIISLSLGDFHITRVIGQGGNGIVYAATFHDTEVAIKFLISEKTGKSLNRQITRFITEYFNIMLLEDKEGIVNYIDFDILNLNDDEGDLQVPAIIMKLYSTSLAKYPIERSEESIRELFKFLLLTFAKIHQQGIIHRDIKPENILVQAGKFVIADFGIASYNPEMFHLMVDTPKDERLGNRVFSAPEQEQAGVDPHPTMDIYSLGQIIQWFVFGEPHRGTGRRKIVDAFSGLHKLDMAIEVCLANNPRDRFQTIEEILSFSPDRIERKDPFPILMVFNEICRKTLPKNVRNFVLSNDPKKIDLLFGQILDRFNEFQNTLRIYDGRFNYEFTLYSMRPTVWKFDNKEVTIDWIWMHYEPRHYKDFILAHYIPGEPFNIDGVTTFEAVQVDGKHYISYEEYYNGYAEIEDQVVDLSNHEVVDVVRQRKGGYFFISTIFHTVWHPNNERVVREFCESNPRPQDITIDMLEELEHKLAQGGIHEDVLSQL